LETLAAEEIVVGPPDALGTTVGAPVGDGAEWESRGAPQAIRKQRSSRRTVFTPASET
jgi:hypothetical protein